MNKVKYIGDNNNKLCLTFGKRYEVLKSGDYSYVIENDKGIRHHYIKLNFEIVESRKTTPLEALEIIGNKMVKESSKWSIELQLSQFTEYIIIKQALDKADKQDEKLR